LLLGEKLSIHQSLGGGFKYLHSKTEHLLFSLSPGKQAMQKKKDLQGPIENICSNSKQNRAGTSEDVGNQLRESDR
jgi:hypothetical protein